MAQAGTGSSNDGCENIDQDLKFIGMGGALNELLNDGEVTSAEIALIPGFHDAIVASCKTAFRSLLEQRGPEFTGATLRVMDQNQNLGPLVTEALLAVFAEEVDK